MLRLVYVLAFAFVPTSVSSSNGKILYFCRTLCVLFACMVRELHLLSL